MRDSEVREALIAKAQGNPRAQADLALFFVGENRMADAYRLAVAAAEAAPDDRYVARIVSETLHDCAPAWFGNIAHDAHRVAAFDAAIRAAVRPGMRVLEIGTGTGLFAMMAARAGAAQVTSFEINPAIAALAGYIVARNGFGERIRVIAKNVQNADVYEIGGPADLLISEIMTINLLAPPQRQVIDHAVANLLKPGAPLIPFRATARVALAEDTAVAERRLGQHGGFDLSPFNRLMPSRSLTSREKGDVILRSAAADIVTQEFRADRRAPSVTGSVELKASGGLVTGVVQWVVLDLHEGISHENAPGTPAEAWSPAFYALETPVDLPAGTRVSVHAEQRGQRLRVWVEDQA